jgi:membrane protein involved in colicin uptake
MVAANLIRSYDQEVNWEALQQLDPAEYIRQRELQAQRAQAWNQTKTRVESLRTEQKKAKQAQAAQRLVEAIPEWLDPVRANAEATQLLEGAKHYGLTAQDIDDMADHRVVVVLRDALAYRALKDKTASTKEEVKKAPVMAKPGTVKQGNPQALHAHRTIEKAKQSGKTEDAAAAFDAFLSGGRRK